VWNIFQSPYLNYLPLLLLPLPQHLPLLAPLLIIKMINHQHQQRRRKISQILLLLFLMIKNNKITKNRWWNKKINNQKEKGIDYHLIYLIKFGLVGWKREREILDGKWNGRWFVKIHMFHLPCHYLSHNLPSHVINSWIHCGIADHMFWLKT